MNLTLLIVDDEVWIRTNLMHHYDWAQFGITRVLGAEHGEEALEIMGREPVNYLITDMDMPFMNGLSLIDYVHVSYPQVHIIVVSGYDEYALVRGALVGGAIDYLLKPLKKEEIYALMARLTASKHETITSSEQLRTALTESGHEAAPGLAESWQLVLLRICQEELPEAVQSVLQKGVSCCLEEDPPREHAALLPLPAAEALMKVCSTCTWHQPAQLLCSMPLPGEAQVDLASLRQQLDAHYLCRVCDTQMLQIFLDHPLEDGQSVNRLPPGYGRGLARSVTIDAAQAAEQLAATFSPERLMQEGWTYAEARMAGMHCARALLNAAEQHGRTHEQMAPLYDMRDRLERAFSGGWLTIACEGLCDMCRQSGAPKKEGVTVEDLQSFIDTHYTELEGLDDLSQHFHFSSAYLARVFKNGTGTTVVAYRTAVRMRAACALLEQGYAINEVAFRVGYEDATYFSQVFRRQMGVTPSAWQKAHLDKSKSS